MERVEQYIRVPGVFNVGESDLVHIHEEQHSLGEVI